MTYQKVQGPAGAVRPAAFENREGGSRETFRLPSAGSVSASMTGRAAGPKRVLMITYAFPPTAYVGVYRSLKYCKYLPSYGWVPIVLTADPSRVAHRDDALLQQIPADVEVHRTFDVDPGKWLDRLMEVRRRRRKARPQASGAAGEKPAATTRRVGILTRIKWLLVTLAIGSPDSHIFWVPFAVLRGAWILLTRRVDVIYCSTPPHSSHFIAFILAKVFRKPYVLDFRDPWLVANSAHPPGYKLRWLLKLETWAKQRIVRGAAAAIAVSEGERRELRSEFADLEESRFSYITNGFDPDDAPPVTSEPVSNRKLTLIHAGTIYSGIAGEFLGALQQLADRYPAAAERLHVDLLGEIAIEYRDAVAELERAGIVTYHGLQPHRRTLELQRASDVLVLLLGGTYFPASHLPAKTFEYLHVGKPIFAIATEGDLTGLLRQSGMGIVVDRGSSDAVLAALLRLIEAHAAGTLTRHPNREFISRFERRSLAQQLAGILDAAIETSRVSVAGQ